MIFNIQRFSTHDGEGIRTIIFFKGCPLRCQWCSNPESQLFTPELMYDPEMCQNFGDCILKAYPAISASITGLLIDRQNIRDYESLRDVCMSKAIRIVGVNKQVDEIIEEIAKDIPFYKQSGGGVTLSGGEPLAQDEELIFLLHELKSRSVDVSVETSLHVKWQHIDRTLGYVSTYLVDLKHTDNNKFRYFTHGNAELVLENLRKLAATNENIIIRIPVIPGFNHTEKEMEHLIDFADSLDAVDEIHFIPYHSLGKNKYTMLGMDYIFNNNKPVAHHELAGYVQYAESKGFSTRIGG